MTMKMALSGRIRKRHLDLLQCSDIAPQRPYSLPDLKDINMEGIFNFAFEYGHPSDKQFESLAYNVIAANPYLSVAQSEAKEWKGKAGKALAELNECVKAITLPDGVAESAKEFYLVYKGRIRVPIEKIGTRELDEKGTLYLDADELYPLNRENFGRIQELHQQMRCAAGRTQELNKMVANDLGSAMADAIKQYAIKTIRDTPWYSPKAWGKRRRIRFGTWKQIFNGVQTYIDNMVPVFSYDLDFDSFNEAIEQAKLNEQVVKTVKEPTESG